MITYSFRTFKSRKCEGWMLLAEPLADCRSQSVTVTRLPTTSDLLLDQEKVALLKKSALAGDSNPGCDDFVQVFNAGARFGSGTDAASGFPL